MINRDYTKEVGLSSGRKPVSRPIAVVVIAAVLSVVGFSVASVINESKAAHEKPAAAKPAN